LNQSDSGTSLKTPWPLWIPWATAFLTLSSLFSLGLIGWPGTFAAAGSGFCEAFRDGIIKQPANTWSNLGFVVAGLWITVIIRRDIISHVHYRNLIGSSLNLGVLYATLVVLLGPGSMAMHATGTTWGGTLDVLSMLLYIVFPVAYSLARLVGARTRVCFWCYLALGGGLGFFLLTGTLRFSGSTLYTWLVPVIVIIETALRFKRHPRNGDLRWLGLATGIFLLGLTIWRLSHTGEPLCQPTSLLQGHAIWHILCAVATASIFLYYRSEEELRRP